MTFMSVHEAGANASVEKVTQFLQQNQRITPMPAERIENLPEALLKEIEEKSGANLSGVKVHYNSPTAAQMNAHAYSQGSDIYLAPGQEMHLAHEAWHVVQQRQGRVQPTMQM